MPAPDGYERLPEGTVCRCVFSWIDNGVFWCCKADPSRRAKTMSPLDDIKDLSSSADMCVAARLREIGTKPGVSHEEQLTLNAVADRLVLGAVKFEYQELDGADGPSFWWTNPWTGQREKIASLWWPGHPPQMTTVVEDLFQGLTLQFNPKR